jgi:hypothetical protein
LLAKYGWCSVLEVLIALTKEETTMPKKGMKLRGKRMTEGSNDRPSQTRNVENRTVSQRLIGANPNPRAADRAEPRGRRERERGRKLSLDVTFMQNEPPSPTERHFLDLLLLPRLSRFRNGGSDPFFDVRAPELLGLVARGDGLIPRSGAGDPDVLGEEEAEDVPGIDERREIKRGEGRKVRADQLEKKRGR